MKGRLSKVVVAAVAAGAMGLPASSPAQSDASVADRLARLERVVNSDTLVQLLDRVERLQSEVQALRGELEVQTHTLSQIKQRQRELYLDVDRRLNTVERGAVAPRDPGTSQAAAAAPDPTETTPAQPAVGTTQPTVEGTPEPSASLNIDPIKEQDSYQSAFNMLKAGRYDQAVTQFSSFLAEYPKGRFADNAQYWLGEAYYVTRQFEAAMQEFKRLIDVHPNSPKLTHALLKLGYIHDEMGECKEAQQVLTDLVTRYPQTTAARLGRERLQRIRCDS